MVPVLFFCFFWWFNTFCRHVTNAEVKIEKSSHTLWGVWAWWDMRKCDSFIGVKVREDSLLWEGHLLEFTDLLLVGRKSKWAPHPGGKKRKTEKKIDTWSSETKCPHTTVSPTKVSPSFPLSCGFTLSSQWCPSYYQHMEEWTAQPDLGELTKAFMTVMYPQLTSSPTDGSHERSEIWLQSMTGNKV